MSAALAARLTRYLRATFTLTITPPRSIASRGRER